MIKPSNTISIALVGNPNIGKTSLFNALTGLNQKVGNYPGVTVDKKKGNCTFPGQQEATILDLPGMYSLYPKSEDERIASQALLDPLSPDYPKKIILLIDAAHLERNLILATQILDLQIPCVIGLTMNDVAIKKGISINIKLLEERLNTTIVVINPRTHEGIEALKNAISQLDIQEKPKAIIDFSAIANHNEFIAFAASNNNSPYGAWQLFCQNPDAQKNIKENINTSTVQAKEIKLRLQKTNQIAAQVMQRSAPKATISKTQKVDNILLHPLWGTIILLAVLFIIFQSIFNLSSYPMDWVEYAFAWIGQQADTLLPDNWIKSLLIDGILAGLSGIAVFVPQIMILFGFITLLEDTGYMARISFLSDRIMRSVGLNGKSVMPLVSGVACAVPAIMSARTIQNPKERLITILVTPLMSCSARLPVYTILISLIIPERTYFHIVSLQGLVLMGLYLLGFVTAMLIAKILDWCITSAKGILFLQELPDYHAPRWKNLWVTMIEKAKIFTLQAGKVIFIVSIILWLLSSFGPSAKMEQLEQERSALLLLEPTREAEINQHFAMQQLEYSYAGHLGKLIEPVISPLGYDWKIGIAVITSFAAREVFVGTMATLYSVGDIEDSDLPLREKMHQATKADGTPVYTLATGVSLLFFYAFALQCISTLAIAKRETNSWIYPTIQFVYMGILAYGAAWLAYMLLK